MTASAGLAALAGLACGGVAWGASGLARERRGIRWAAGAAAGRPGLGWAKALGAVQSKLPGLAAIARRLHAGPALWLGARDPGPVAWLAVREAAALAAGGLAAWLAEDLVTGGAVAVAGAALPDVLARRAWMARQERIRRELPDVLDLLALALEAGLSVDAGLAQVAEKLPGGPIAREIARMLGEVRLGARRHQAWRDAGARLGNTEVAEVLSALAQADALGVSLAQSLQGLADQARARRRQRAEELAQKAPVKLLFPLILFIFPAVFIVLLGPVVLQLLATVRGL